MRLAICNELFEGWTWQEVCDYAAQVGYQGLEVAPFTLGPRPLETSQSDRAMWRQMANDRGLEIIGLHWLLAKTAGLHLISRDSGVREATGEYLAGLARLCAHLGGTLMVLGSPAQRQRADDMGEEEALDLAATTLRIALPTLEAHGVTLAFEPLSPAETNFVTTAAMGRELVQRLESPQVRLHLDVKAMSSETCSYRQIILESREWLVHFHANDPNRLGPGMGDVDFAEVIPALRAIGYRGWLSVEVFDYSPGARAIAEHSIAYLRRHLDA